MVAEVDLLDAGARAGLLLCPLDGAQALFLFRQRRIQLDMGVVLREAGGGQFGGVGDEEGFPEVLAAQLTRECQSSRCEEHLLPDLGGVGDVGDGDQLGSGLMAAEDDVEGLVGLEVRGQRRQVLGEGGGWGCGREQLNGHERLGFDRRQEAEVGVGR